VASIECEAERAVMVPTCPTCKWYLKGTVEGRCQWPDQFTYVPFWLSRSRIISPFFQEDAIACPAHEEKAKAERKEIHGTN